MELFFFDNKIYSVGVLSAIVFWAAAGGAALVDDPHAGEDAEGGGEFGDGQGVHAGADGYGDGDDGLQIAVHADQGGADALLSDGDEQVGHKGG